MAAQQETIKGSATISSPRATAGVRAAIERMAAMHGKSVYRINAKGG
jgi:hypothetical protein